MGAYVEHMFRIGACIFPRRATRNAIDEMLSHNSYNIQTAYAQYVLRINIMSQQTYTTAKFVTRASSQSSSICSEDSGRATPESLIVPVSSEMQGDVDEFLDEVSICSRYAGYILM